MFHKGLHWAPYSLYLTNERREVVQTTNKPSPDRFFFFLQSAKATAHGFYPSAREGHKTHFPFSHPVGDVSVVTKQSAAIL